MIFVRLVCKTVACMTLDYGHTAKTAGRDGFMVQTTEQNFKPAVVM
jgi:hypothetical protein